MNASESSEGFFGFLSGGQLLRHILVAQRILPRNTNFCRLREHRVMADVLLKNFVAAAVFSVSYFLNLLKNFVGAYQNLREACAILGFLSGGQLWRQFVTFLGFTKLLLFMLLFKHFVFLI